MVNVTIVETGRSAMTTYYYVTNGDGTTYNRFRPFANGDIAEASDWVPDNRECGAGLHVVEDDPTRALDHVLRDYPRAFEVEPIDARPACGGKIRCRALRLIRELSVEEFAAFFIARGPEGANRAAGNGHLDCLRACIAAGVRPTPWGANRAAGNGHLGCLQAVIAAGVLPTYLGANEAAANGHLGCLQAVIAAGVLPTAEGANFAAIHGHLACLRAVIAAGARPTFYGADWAAENGHLECAALCRKVLKND
jgi:hypothetical protein